MTQLDRVFASPLESFEARQARARQRAHAQAPDCPWLAAVLRHHAAIEEALEALGRVREPSACRQALRWLATLMKGHALAEDTVLYPALAFDGQRAHAVCAFADESRFRMDLAALAQRQPGTPAYVDKLDALRADLALHFHEEEGSWYPALCRRGDARETARLAAAFEEEFRRYMGPDADLL